MFRFRKIKQTDWDDISLIQDLCYPAEARENVETLKCHWLVSPDFCFIASEETVIAYILAHPWKRRVAPPINIIYSGTGNKNDTVFIHDIALHPKSQGKGVAKALTSRLFEVADENGFNHFSLISVQGTVGFWQKLGFVVVTNLPRHYFKTIEKHYPGGGYFYMEKEVCR